MTSETDAEFLNRLNHEWVHDCVPCVEDWERLFALARRGAAVENLGQIEKLSEELERVKREAERAQDAHGVRFLNYLEETARLTDRIEQLEDEGDKARARADTYRMALEDIAYGDPLHNENDMMRIARAALEGK